MKDKNEHAWAEYQEATGESTFDYWSGTPDYVDMPDSWNDRAIENYAHTHPPRKDRMDYSWSDGDLMNMSKMKPGSTAYQVSQYHALAMLKDPTTCKSCSWEEILRYWGDKAHQQYEAGKVLENGAINIADNCGFCLYKANRRKNGTLPKDMVLIGGEK